MDAGTRADPGGARTPTPRAGWAMSESESSAARRNVLAGTVLEWACRFLALHGLPETAGKRLA